MTLPRSRGMSDEELERQVRTVLATPQAIGALREYLERSDYDALTTLRGVVAAPDACDVLFHNERVRNAFRAALKDGEQDPFDG